MNKTDLHALTAPQLWQQGKLLISDGHIFILIESTEHPDPARARYQDGKPTTINLFSVRVSNDNWLLSEEQESAVAQMIVDSVSTAATHQAEIRALREAVKNALDKVFNDGKQPEGWVQIQTSALDELRTALSNNQ